MIEEYSTYYINCDGDKCNNSFNPGCRIKWNLLNDAICKDWTRNIDTGNKKGRRSF